jgi:hypothetical protein
MSTDSSKPVFSCGQVCSREEQQQLVSGSKKAEQFLQTFVDQKKYQGLESAIQQRNRLLEYDRSRQVIKCDQLCLYEIIQFSYSILNLICALLYGQCWEVSEVLNTLRVICLQTLILTCQQSMLHAFFIFTYFSLVCRNSY